MKAGLLFVSLGLSAVVQAAELDCDDSKNLSKWECSEDRVNLSECDYALDLRSSKATLSRVSCPLFSPMTIKGSKVALLKLSVEGDLHCFADKTYNKKFTQQDVSKCFESQFKTQQLSLGQVQGPSISLKASADKDEKGYEALIQKLAAEHTPGPETYVNENRVPASKGH